MLEKLIIYFVYKTKGHITKTQLVKFLYLADLYAVKWTGKPLTDLNWYCYKFGPWNSEIERVLTEMEGETILSETQGDTVLIKPANIKENLNNFHLPLGIKLMLDNIRKEWAGSGKDKLKSLIDYTYNTEPMSAFKNLSSIDKQQKIPLNLQLEHKKIIEELGS